VRRGEKRIWHFGNAYVARQSRRVQPIDNGEVNEGDNREGREYRSSRKNPDEAQGKRTDRACTHEGCDVREPEPRADGHDMSEAVAAQSDSGREGAQSILMMIVAIADGE